MTRHLPKWAPLMAEETQHLDAALKAWGLERAHVQLVATRENKVYRVEQAGQTWALKEHRPGLRSRAQLTSELGLLAYLASNGLKVPQPVPAADGSLLVNLDRGTFSLCQWMAGQALSDMAFATYDLAMAERLGECVAGFHSLSESWQPPKGFDRPDWTIEGLVGERPVWGRFWDCAFLTTEEQKLLGQARARARELLETLELKPMLIHADLMFENLLVDQDEICLIDFDDSAWGYAPFDLATVLNRFERESLDERGAQAFLQAYARAGGAPLDPQTRVLFQALRAFTYVGWIADKLDEPGGRERLTRFVEVARDHGLRLLGI